MALRCFTSDKEKLLADNFSKNYNLDDLGISLPVFPYRNNPKLHNIPVTFKLVKKIIINLDCQRCQVVTVFQWCF